MSAAKTNGTWPTVRLGEVLRLRVPDVAVEPTQTYQFAGVYCFGRGVFRGQEKQGAQFAYRKLTRVRAGEFVYPKLMAWEGAFGVVPVECDGCHVSPEFPVFEVNTSRIAPRFLGLHFQRPTVWATVSGGSTGTNMRRRRLNPTDFLRREISLPPLAEQQRIADHLDAIAARVARVRAALTDNEADLQRLIFRKLEQMTSNAPVLPLCEVAPLVRREVPINAALEYAEIGIRSFYKGIFHRRTMKGSDYTWQKLFWIRPGDLVFSNIMAWEKAIAVAQEIHDGYVGNHRMLTCEPRSDRVLPSYLWHYFTTQEGFARIVAASPGTVARNKTMSGDDLMKVTVPVPPLERQQWFDTLCGKVAALRAHHEAQCADLVALHPSLLDRAFNGEL